MDRKESEGYRRNTATRALSFYSLPCLPFTSRVFCTCQGSLTSRASCLYSPELKHINDVENQGGKPHDLVCSFQIYDNNFVLYLFYTDIFNLKVVTKEKILSSKEIHFVLYIYLTSIKSHTVFFWEKNTKNNNKKNWISLKKLAHQLLLSR